MAIGIIVCADEKHGVRAQGQSLMWEQQDVHIHLLPPGAVQDLFFSNPYFLVLQYRLDVVCVKERWI